jgi:hypothetical protein
LAPTLQNNARELLVKDLDGKTVTIPLDRDRISLGRSSANELCYPDDAGLSRQHMAITRVNGEWQVEDLGSKNGTLLNGQRVERATPFRLGDRIAAGHLTIEFADAGQVPANTVVFVDNAESFSNTATTVVASLDAVLGPQADDLNKTVAMSGAMSGSPQMRAFGASAAGGIVPSRDGSFHGSGDGRSRRTDDSRRRGTDRSRGARRGVQDFQHGARPCAE